jgi:octaprenyl-diphosphate synthase
MRPDKIYSLVKDRIGLVEDEIHNVLACDVAIVSEMGAHITESGGKRIRPALLSLCAAACGYKGDKDVRYGVVYELVHTATLIHDDIIDNAELRRGKTVMHKRFGTTLSILFGDLLYNSAMDLALRDDDLRIIRLICRATTKMIEGEIIQSERNYSVRLDMEEYLDIVRRKTAHLFSACALTGAILAGTGEPTEKALADYGLNLGVAFQIVDDYLDYTSTREVLGKPTCGDLIEGKVTYPLLLLLTKSREAVELVKQVFIRRTASKDELNTLLEMMSALEVLEDTLDAAKEYAETALEAVSILPASRFSEALNKLPDYVIERRK